MTSRPDPGLPCRQILGIRFFAGSAREAVALGLKGGVVVVPSAPVLQTLVSDPANREALLNSDLAIADSGLMVLLWNLLTRDRLKRVSGLEYLKLLLDEPAFRVPGAALWVMPSAAAMRKNLAWLTQQGHPVTEEDCYIAPHYRPGNVADDALVDLLNSRRPAQVVMAIGGGTQEKLAYYLKRNVCYRPAIHCTGAAIGFLSGDQTHIPAWADRFFLGWLFRSASDPRRFIPRYWKARKVIPLLLKYREHCPAIVLEK